MDVMWVYTTTWMLVATGCFLVSPLSFMVLACSHLKLPGFTLATLNHLSLG